MTALSAIERRVIAATQAGLPLVPRPYAEIGKAIGASEADTLAIVSALLDRGVIRRIAAAPNHYALGMTANGMTVWDVADERASALGAAVGALPFVTHCYLRPRARPLWPYNLFAMVHGRSAEEIAAKRAEIAALLDDACFASDMLVSTRILKKTGLRLTGGKG